jgi:hypothetical protein
MKICEREACNNPARRKYCSKSCATLAWRERNQSVYKTRQRVYALSSYRRNQNKPQQTWEVRREAIIEKYGATRQWKRKQEVSG